MSTAATCRTAPRTVHVEDRGYQFADGVYEVCEVRGGRLVDERRHMDRLERSLGELRIAMPMPRNALGVVLRETVRAQPRARRHRLSADHARRGAARPRVSAARHAAEHRRHRARTSTLDEDRAGRRRRHRGDHGAGQPLGAGRHQVGRRCCRTCWPSRRRARRARRRPGSSMPRRLRHRGLLDQCLDRDARRRGGHAPGRSSASCAASPARSCSRSSPSTG